MKKIKYITWLLVTIFLVSNAAFAEQPAEKRNNKLPLRKSIKLRKMVKLNG